MPKKELLIPTCPRCDHLMVKRNSANRAFWGCSQYPTCRGSRPIVDTPSNGTPSVTKSKSNAVASEVTPIVKMPGSSEQEAIWEHALNQTSHIVIEARAGTGKTWTCVQLCLRLAKTTNIGFVAFNKHIAQEAQGKLRASGCSNVLCCTYHSLGLRAVKAAFPNAQIDQFKTDGVLEHVPKPYSMKDTDWSHIQHLTSKLVGFAKNYLLDPQDPEFLIRLEELADHHGLDLNDVGQKALELVGPVLQESKRLANAVIDFDDMIWLPVVLNLPIPVTFDFLIVDEYQDSNITQQELALRFCPKGRMVIVGDRFQAIYSFRGADTMAIPRAIERLGATERSARVFPLTITRRCPKSHVNLVHSIVADIRALDDAPEGVVLSVSGSQAISMMKAGDMVLCRVNAALIPAAYTLLRRGIRPLIRGRDLGKGLLDLVAKLEKNATSLPALQITLDHYRHEETLRLSALGNKALGRLSTVNDRSDCLTEFVREATSIPDLKAKIESLFADFEADGRPRECVVLGTVHRTKGLEAERVFVLSPELLPHPMARQPHEQQGERNLAYVAATRAKFTKSSPGTLIFCGAIPGIFAKPETEEKGSTVPV